MKNKILLTTFCILSILLLAYLIWNYQFNKKNSVITHVDISNKTITLFKPGYNLSKGWSVNKSSSKIDSGYYDIKLTEDEGNIKLEFLEWSRYNDSWEQSERIESNIFASLTNKEKKIIVPFRDGNTLIFDKRNFELKQEKKDNLILTINLDEKEIIILKKDSTFLPKTYHLTMHIDPFELLESQKDKIIDHTSDHGALLTEEGSLDLKLSILNNDKNVYNKNLIRNYTFGQQTPPLNIDFYVIQNDKITINISDNDLINDDRLDSWRGDWNQLVKDTTLDLRFIKKFTYHASVK